MRIKDSFVELQHLIGVDVDKSSFYINGLERKMYAERLMFYEIAVKVAALSDRMPFFKYTKNSQSRSFARASELGAKILAALDYAECNRLFEWDSEFYEHVMLPPQLKLVYQACYAAKIPGGSLVEGVGFVKYIKYSHRKYFNSKEEVQDDAINCLNEFSENLKKSLRKYSFREKIKSFERNSRERYFQLMNVASQGWDKNCKNILIRVDWGFKKENLLMPVRFKNEKEMSDVFNEVDCLRKRMLKSIKRIFGADLTFYAWKIECGDIKGLHIHWLVAVNGSKRMHAGYAGKEIVDEWNKYICDKNSYAFNVNYLKGGYRSGLRLIDYRDEELPEILDRYVGYLTKMDFLMKLRVPGNMRTFGCSKLKKQTNEKCGPKRSGISTLKEKIK